MCRPTDRNDTGGGAMIYVPPTQQQARAFEYAVFSLENPYSRLGEPMADPE